MTDESQISECELGFPPAPCTVLASSHGLQPRWLLLCNSAPLRSASDMPQLVLRSPTPAPAQHQIHQDEGSAQIPRHPCLAPRLMVPSIVRRGASVPMVTATATATTLALPKKSHTGAIFRTQRTSSLQNSTLALKHKAASGSTRR